VRPSFAIPPDWPCWLAEDPGYDHPTAILVLTVAPNGKCAPLGRPAIWTVVAPAQLSVPVGVL
jgi:hypothetical protein